MGFSGWDLGVGVTVLSFRFRVQGFGVWDSGFIVGTFGIGISLASSTRSISGAFQAGYCRSTSMVYGVGVHPFLVRY